MKIAILLSLATAGIMVFACGTSLDWQVLNLQDVTSTSPNGISQVSFDFFDPTTGLSTTCDYRNAPGSGHPATVETLADCGFGKKGSQKMVI
jgi:hypothetical protein